MRFHSCWISTSATTQLKHCPVSQKLLIYLGSHTIYCLIRPHFASLPAMLVHFKMARAMRPCVGFSQSETGCLHVTSRANKHHVSTSFFDYNRADLHPIHQPCLARIEIAQNIPASQIAPPWASHRYLPVRHDDPGPFLQPHTKRGCNTCLECGTRRCGREC